MNDKQNKALKALERAFVKCRKANLAFQGMDETLLVFDAGDYTKRTKEGPICDQQYVNDGYQGEIVNTHECYKDSGGW